MAPLSVNKEIIRLCADTIRVLSAEAVQRANSGHPGMPMGMADCATVLWTRFMRYDPAHPEWPNRDRFVLSAGHGSMLLYSLLHLSGYDLTMDDIRNFRQWGSRTPGHPEYGQTAGVETTTGPLGQGFANGVGMALAAKMTAARFGSQKQPVLGTHRVYGIVGDGDLMEGISSEAASLAGHLQLGNLIYFYDSNRITIDGSTDLSFSESVADRFRAYGWQVVEIDGHDHEQITAALMKANSEAERPSLIIAKTHIGYGSPNKQDSEKSHGAPLGEEELIAAKKQLGFSTDQEFFVPDSVRQLWAEVRERLDREYGEWQRQYQQWRNCEPEQAQAYDRFMARELPDTLEEKLLEVIPEEAAATRALSGQVLQKLTELLPGLVGGSADLAASNKNTLKKYSDIKRGDFSGRNFNFGIREHAMGGICNGIALYGGFRPFGATFFVFSDYMRPAIRMAALMKIPVNYIFTHDSIFVGEDGPTHQPVEHLTSLRAIPHMTVIRPADGLEVAMAWSIAMRHQAGPTALILTRQKLPQLPREEEFTPDLVARGAYILAREKEARIDLILLASGSEVQLTLGAKEALEKQGYSVRAVSVPSIELFHQQPQEYQRKILPDSARAALVIEAGVSLGWGDLVRIPYAVVGIDKFGASANYQVLAEKYGLTTVNVIQRALEVLRSIQ